MIMINLFVDFGNRQLEYGLKYDKNSQFVQKNKLWKSGKHFIGLGVEFIKFSRDQQILLMSSNAQNEKRSKKGARFEE